jgi:hypothetical protein
LQINRKVRPFLHLLIIILVAVVGLSFIFYPTFWVQLLLFILLLELELNLIQLIQ